MAVSSEHGQHNFKSYSNVIAVALVDYFDRYYRSQDDPYFETREREERFVNQIISSVESAMEKTLPVFLAGCMVGMLKCRLEPFRSHSRNWMRKWIGIFLENKFAPS